MMYLYVVCRTVNVEPHTVLLEEGGVKLALTVVDTPGTRSIIIITVII